MSIKVGR